ncbi:PREDICTED: G-protein coupled receptor Mth2-like [Dufourea novaeangliae]|uniref:G-protein coupled receptor Mth2-like n=1 Tax=Dufourea novaeangliae TaxID=178035 RepID=UPI000767B587|nr:PREDICTED: G-protein coupled receptor Mth2-like [Dufourea novaeangliae]
MLGAGDRPSCKKLPNRLQLGSPDLVLERAQLAPEIHGINGIGDLFVLVEDMACPDNSVRYMLEPERYEEDAFVLERNGTLRTSTSKFPAWSYCLDWKESFERIVVLVCLSPDSPTPSPANEQESYNIGIIVSVPFFLATFLVYAIIPELRSLYGKTLMCYVACLVIAYTFLVLAKSFYFASRLCSAIARKSETTVVTVTSILSILSILSARAINVESFSGLDFTVTEGSLAGVEPVTFATVGPLANIVENSDGTERFIGLHRNERDTRNNSSDETSDKPLVHLCCPLESRMIKNSCLTLETNVTIRFPPLYRSNSFDLLDASPTPKSFRLAVRDPCDGGPRYRLVPETYDEDAFLLLDNGAVYRPNGNVILPPSEYCLGRVDVDKYDVVLCFEADDYDETGESNGTNIIVSFPIGLIVSVPFLLATFIVYSLIPELKNMHGRTLRCYVGSLLIAYTVLAIVQILPQYSISDPLCVAFAFIIHFSFLASFFWLNVMCFDIWWTFGGFRSLQGSVKQRERKKFIIYSIYAWGCASILTGVCILMDFLPNIPTYFIRPQFGMQSCWFTTDEAKAIYFYGPMGVTVFCNICLFVSTALKIVKHTRDTAHHLNGADSRRHDDNKQWFNLYLKLFIVMGINWSMEIISWLCNNSPTYIWYLTDLTNTLQGVIIFLIFVWKEKIRRLLLKRLGCHGRNFLSRNSTRSAYHSSASRTCTTSAAPTASIPFQQKFNPHQLKDTLPLRSGKPPLSDDSNDCP